MRPIDDYSAQLILDEAGNVWAISQSATPDRFS
jgi:hypothetical protein